ncbi:hypothetical protein DOY81_007525 [Sarcophaga bullata]|nr:hypothetical protein DOY81_007525 [Sarcophaga bullata]
MCRFENVPWGFRLVGGSDFEFPLTVVKVTEGSIAEQAGLMVGDIIVRINDTAATPLTHDETNKVIRGCGNVFYFGVQRENEEEFTTPKAFPMTERVKSPKSFLEAGAVPTPPVQLLNSRRQLRGERTRTVQGEDYISDLEERPCSVLSEETERKLVEEEIAAVLSGESEVLKEHNTLGIFPKPGVCMSSDVLRTLNEDATKTKAEKEKENRKWTTFLQKPDRPIPKSKQQIEAERRAANAYKVKIIKGSALSRSVSPAPPIKPVEEVKPPKEPTPPPVVQSEPEPEPEPEPEAPTPVDSEVPNLEETKTSEPKQAEQEEQEAEKTDKEKESTTEIKEIEDKNQNNADETKVDEEGKPEVEKSEEVQPEPVIEKTEEELALERQLADVQKQLAALSNLPSTIQSTLDAVTKQLADILPTFKLQQEQPRRLSGSVAREINLEDISETAENEDRENDENKDVKQTDNETENCHESVDNVQAKQEEKQEQEQQQEQEQKQQQDNKANEQIANDTNEARDTIDKNPIKQQETAAKRSTSNEETLQMEEEQKLKKQKKYDVIEELEEHLERKSNPKRSKRAFGPLTPASDRPLVLPGGRRWYRPKDAYNDEFIAETLSAQAELITGTCLGSNCGIVYLMVKIFRVLYFVNFMKYQKPEKKIDLNRSEVYKVIHHLDRQPVRGIEVRPPVVPAEVDIRKSLQTS